MVASGDQSQHLMRHNDEIKRMVRSVAASGAQLLLVDRAPSAFNDFVFGLSESWFADSQSPEFPSDGSVRPSRLPISSELWALPSL